MFKKIAIAVAAITVGVSLIVGPVYLISLVSSCLQDARNWAHDQVPPETEIHRLRHEIAKLDRDTADHIDAIAKKKVAVEQLASDVKGLEKNLTAQKSRLALLRAAVNGEKTLVSEVTGIPYTKDRLTQELDRAVATYESTELALKTKQEVLVEEEKGLEAGMDELRAMKQAKTDLGNELTRLETELKKVRAAEAKSTSRIHIDNSRLDRIKKDMEHLRTKIKERKESLKLREQFGNEPIHVKEQVNEKDLMKKVDDILGNKANKVVHND
jgi:peptidoglycan hydrolase CwlO-like protein